jgi:hypothetical protein
LDSLLPHCVHQAVGTVATIKDLTPGETFFVLLRLFCEEKFWICFDIRLVDSESKRAREELISRPFNSQCQCVIVKVWSGSMKQEENLVE